MASVSVAVTVPGSVHEVERCWYDTARWSVWVDGLARVSSVEGRWPAAGSSVAWESGPAGRGRVVERVVAYEPLAGQTVDVEDDSISGQQSISFTPTSVGVGVTLTLSYTIKRRSLLTPLVDLLFIRRAMSASLRSTLTRFAAELAAFPGH
jgi:Polyketide cyclase / dehydrase and lipid transport